MVNTIPIEWIWYALGFWYFTFIFWILLVASIIVFVIAIVKKSWKIMLASVLIFLPNAVALVSPEWEKIMYILLLWFVTQIIMLIKIFRTNRKGAVKNLK